MSYNFVNLKEAKSFWKMNLFEEINMLLESLLLNFN